MTEYTIRLADGNEYGPVDEAGLRRWYEEGRVLADAWVLAAGAPEWRPLNAIFDLQTWPPPTDSSTVAYARPTRTRTSPEPRPSSEPRRRSGQVIAVLASALIVLVLGALAVRSYLAGGGSPRQRALREWAAADRQFLDPESGLTLRLPEGWVLLRKESPLVTEDVRAKLGDVSQGAVASLAMESVPKGIATLDHYVDRFVEERQKTLSSFRELARSDRLLSSVSAKTLSASWTADGVEWKTAAAVWQDGWNYFVLSASCPALDATTLSSRFEALASGLTLTQPLSARIRAAAARVAEAAPQLSAAAAERLVRDGMSRGVTIEEMAQSSFRLVSKGYAALAQEEVRELGQIYSEVYAPISPEDRVRLAAYLNKIKARAATAPEEDQEMKELMKAGVLALPDPTRQRLQQLFEKALAAGLVVR